MNLNSQKIFIGHGRNLIWHKLKDFIQNRLKLTADEFNEESVAGKNQQDRLSRMLDDACFAFLIMTGEDQHNDGTFHARENVIHEIGLFQGRLGFDKAIVLREVSCKEFSNIAGLNQIHVPHGNIEAKFEDIRKVLERAGVLKVNSSARNSRPKSWGRIRTSLARRSHIRSRYSR